MRTWSTARDMDVLRAALGDEKLTYLGYSYGTELGGVYAEAFPKNVRALVLDGAISPRQDPIEMTIGQAAASQEGLARWQRNARRPRTARWGPIRLARPRSSRH